MAHFNRDVFQLLAFLLAITFTAIGDFSIWVRFTRCWGYCNAMEKEIQKEGSQQKHSIFGIMYRYTRCEGQGRILKHACLDYCKRSNFFCFLVISTCIVHLRSIPRWVMQVQGPMNVLFNQAFSWRRSRSLCILPNLSFLDHCAE